MVPAFMVQGLLFLSSHTILTESLQADTRWPEKIHRVMLARLTLDHDPGPPVDAERHLATKWSHLSLLLNDFFIPLLHSWGLQHLIFLQLHSLPMTTARWQPRQLEEDVHPWKLLSSLSTYANPCHLLCPHPWLWVTFCVRVNPSSLASLPFTSI